MLATFQGFIVIPEASERSINPQSAGITECQIISWFVRPGDRVEQFDRICEVQSDKASVEITSRFDVTIKALHYKVDDMAVVGQPLLDIDLDDGSIEVEVKPETPTQTPEEENITEDKQERGGSEPQDLPDSTPDLLEIKTELKENPSPVSYSSKSKKGTGLVTPGVRRMLKELDIDIEDIEGAGKEGRVLKEDVQRYTSSISGTGAAPFPGGPENVQGYDRSLAIPHFLYTHSVDLTTLNGLRKRVISSATLANTCDSKLTLLPFIMKALSQAFTQFPTLNSHLGHTEIIPCKPQLFVKAAHHFGLAVDTRQGLLLPVVKNVQNHSVASLANEISRLSSLAKGGRLGVEDLQGATFTISNIGSIGGAAVSPVIIPPMVGILAVGRMRPVLAFAKDGQGNNEIVQREEVILSWSADHRTLDGATVAECAETVGNWLENINTVK